MELGPQVPKVHVAAKIAISCTSQSEGQNSLAVSLEFGRHLHQGGKNPTSEEKNTLYQTCHQHTSEFYRRTCDSFLSYFVALILVQQVCSLKVVICQCHRFWRHAVRNWNGHGSLSRKIATYGCSECSPGSSTHGTTRVCKLVLASAGLMTLVTMPY